MMATKGITRELYKLLNGMSTSLTYPIKDYQTIIMFLAAYDNDEEQCNAIRSDQTIVGHVPYEAMLLGAARGGHLALCCLARLSGAKDYNSMLAQAAAGGHKEICESALSWGATEVDTMCLYAAENRQWDMVKLAVQWGSKCYDMILSYAARAGNLEMCIYAKEHGATSFGSMLCFMEMKNGAVISVCNHVSILEQAFEWGQNGNNWNTSNADDVLLTAAKEGNVEACKLAMRYGACKFEEMMSIGKKTGNIWVMREARIGLDQLKVAEEKRAKEAVAAKPPAAETTKKEDTQTDKQSNVPLYDVIKSLRNLYAQNRTLFYMVTGNSTLRDMVI